MRFYIYDKNNVIHKRFKFIRFKWIIYFLIVQIVIFFSVLFLLSNYHITPKERKLQSEVVYLLNEFDDINSRIIKSENILRYVQETDSIIYQTLFNASDITKKPFNTYIESFIKNDYSYIVNDMNYRISILNKSMAKELFLLHDVYEDVVDRKEMITHIPAIQPIENKNLRRTSSGWGWRMHPIYKIRSFHYGLDFVAPEGTPVYATGDATVQYMISETNKESQGYGNLIILDHGWGYHTLYAHLSKCEVEKGEKVKRGQIIGRVGNTGISTGPHLHYEVMKDGRKVNPVNYLFNSLTPDEYRRIIEISNSIEVSMD